MKLDHLVSDFRNGSSIGELAKEYGLARRSVKALLIVRLGKLNYLGVAHSNGGKVVAKKLRDVGYRRRYQSLMSGSVKRSLAKLMKKKRFRTAVSTATAQRNWCRNT